MSDDQQAHGDGCPDDASVDAIEQVLADAEEEWATLSSADMPAADSLAASRRRYLAQRMAALRDEPRTSPQRVDDVESLARAIDPATWTGPEDSTNAEHRAAIRAGRSDSRARARRALAWFAARDAATQDAIQRVLRLCDTADDNGRYYGREHGGITVAQVRAALDVAPTVVAPVDATCPYVFPLPAWAGENQMDPCRCDLPAGHRLAPDGTGHSCAHLRGERDRD